MSRSVCLCVFARSIDTNHHDKAEAPVGEAVAAKEARPYEAGRQHCVGISGLEARVGLGDLHKFL